MSAAADNVRHQPIDTNAGKEDGQKSEERAELGYQALVSHGASHLLIKCRNVGDAHKWTDGLNGLLNGPGDSGKVSRVANFKVAEAPWALLAGEIVDVCRFFFKTAELHIFDDADNFVIIFWLVVYKAKVLSDWIARGNIVFATCSLITATRCEVAVSAEVKVRPARSGICMVLK
jgi:hypothetical protein